MKKTTTISERDSKVSQTRGNGESSSNEIYPKKPKKDWSDEAIEFLEKLGKVILALAALVWGASKLWFFILDAVTNH